MAALYKDKAHGYRLRYKLYFPDATRKVKDKFFSTKQKAHIALQDVEHLEALALKNRLTKEDLTAFAHLRYITADEARQLLPAENVSLVDPASVTWDALDDVWKSHVKTVGSPATRISYPYKAQPVLDHFKSTAPLKITAQAIKDYIAKRRGKGIAKATINKEINILRVMLDNPVHLGLMTSNPARQIKLFSDLPERLPRALNPQELKAILKAIPHCNFCYGYFPELILTYLFTGMRRYELLELKTKNVDMKQRRIRIIGKGDKERIIDMHPYLAQKVFPSVLKKNGSNKGLYFFGGKDKLLLNENSAGRAFRVFLRDKKLYDNNSIHTLRHTFITYMLDAGVPIKEIQRLAGHSSLKTTLKYTHSIPTGTPAIIQLDYKKHF